MNTVQVSKMPFTVGDIVPYKNTASKVAEAKVESFEFVDNGKVWFRGIDIATKASVYYPVHLSVNLTNLKTPRL